MNTNEGREVQTPIAVGSRLRLARERCGYKQGEVCDATKIGTSTLSDFENGKRAPSLDQLALLASHYNRPLSFFFEEGTPAKEIVLWRARPPSGAEKYESEFRQDCSRYRDLEVWCQDESPYVLPEIPANSSSMGFPQAEELAHKLRNELRLGDRPAFTLLAALEEDCGVKIFHRPLGPTGTAACAIDPYFRAGILLNSKSTQKRRNYDLAHELFHLVTWNLFRATGAETSEQEEKFADKFASTLLLPDEGVRSAVNRRGKNEQLSIPALFDIAREFGVSVEALLWRLHWVYHWKDQERTRTLIVNAQAQARVFENSPQVEPATPTRPGRFQALAVKALKNGDMSVGKFAEYLGISRRKAMSYVGEEPGAHETIELSPP